MSKADAAYQQGYDRGYQRGIEAESARREAERCVWVMNTYAFGGKEYEASCGFIMSIYDYTKEYAYCPSCGKRIEIKEAPNGH